MIDYLSSIDELHNTFVMFMSDNGAEGAAYEAYPVLTRPSPLRSRLVPRFMIHSLTDVSHRWFEDLYSTTSGSATTTVSITLGQALRSSGTARAGHKRPPHRHACTSSTRLKAAFGFHVSRRFQYSQAA